MRGPPGLAIWIPVNTPYAPVPGWVHIPLVLLVKRLSAVMVTHFAGMACE
jgi:hypothetical protein